MTMLNVYDRSTRRKTAVLQNAFNIVETHELNQIYTLSFTLPQTDEKVKFCLPRHYVRWGDDGELYRIKEPKVNDSDVGTITYECEHVITTLCDKVMFGSFTYGGESVKTSAVINWLLGQQSDWFLDECDFDKKFEYGWEQENLLNALYSIPKEFASPYKWTFDTTVYPWRISLKAIDPEITPEYYLRARSNILASGTSADYANICTRIYPLGYGEGVNQLNIRSVNNNVPYLQSPEEIIAQYGIVEKVLVDRKFENAETLKAYAQTMLDLYQTPAMSRTFDVTDLYPLTRQSWDDAEVGKICKMMDDGTTAYITKTKRQLDKSGDLQIDLSTKATDIASNVADLADRVRIESVYAQGATQLYQHSKDANATPSKGMVISLYFPSEMKQINKVLLRMKLNRFRSYSSTTDAGGASTQTSSAGGASTQTSSSGGASTQTSSSGGASTQTSSAGGGTGSSGAATLVGSPNVIISAAETTDPNWTTTDLAIRTMVVNLSDKANYNTELRTLEKGNHTHTTDIRHTHNVSGSTDNTTPRSDDLTHSHYFSTMAEIWGTDRESSLTGTHTHAIEDRTGHSHAIEKAKLKHTHYVSVQNNSGIAGYTGFDHTHNFVINSHTHNISIPAHTHKVSIPSHTHRLSIPSHTHKVSIPSHTHKISAGIFESGNATAFDIYVNGTKKTTVNAKSYDGDITSWLLNSSNQIPRGSWIDVEIRPNDLAYVVSSVFVQGFVQSRGGGNY